MRAKQQPGGRARKRHAAPDMDIGVTRLAAPDDVYDHGPIGAPNRQETHHSNLAGQLADQLSRTLERIMSNGMTFRIGVEFEQTGTLKARQIRPQLSRLKPGRGRDLNQSMPLAIACIARCRHNEANSFRYRKVLVA